MVALTPTAEHIDAQKLTYKLFKQRSIHQTMMPFLTSPVKAMTTFIDAMNMKGTCCWAQWNLSFIKCSAFSCVINTNGLNVGTLAKRLSET